MFYITALSLRHQNNIHIVPVLQAALNLITEIYESWGGARTPSVPLLAKIVCRTGLNSCSAVAALNLWSGCSQVDESNVTIPNILFLNADVYWVSSTFETSQCRESLVSVSSQS